MKVVQFHQALVDFFFFSLYISLLYIFNVTTMFSQQCKIAPQPSLKKKKKEIKALTGAT